MTFDQIKEIMSRAFPGMPSKPKPPSFSEDWANLWIRTSIGDSTPFLGGMIYRVESDLMAWVHNAFGTNSNNEPNIQFLGKNVRWRELAMVEWRNVILEQLN